MEEMTKLFSEDCFFIFCLIFFGRSFWLSLHQLIMMSNLQSLIFGSKNQSQRPSIQPNEYMDSIIDQMKENFKER